MRFEQMLSQKYDLLKEMVKISERLIEILKGTFEDEAIESIGLLLGKRDELIYQIDLLDSELSPFQDNSANACTQIQTEINSLLRELNEQQGQISELLERKMNEVSQDFNKVKTSRRKLKGYYNHQVATTPSFIDKKR